MNIISMQVPKRLFLGALFAAQLFSGHAAVEIGVQTPNIGHAVFAPNIPGLPGPPAMPRSIVDFLIDQDQSSHGGALLPNVAVNWDTNTQFAVTVSAPPGQKFQVRVPAGRAVGFGGFLWWESTRGGFSPSGSVDVSFEGLEGTAPGFAESDSVLSDSHGFFGFMDLEGTTVTNDFAFTSIRLTGTVVPQVTGNGTENYVPHGESSMQLYYQTTETNDSGQFVFLVPAGPATNNQLPVANWIRPTNGASFLAGSGVLLTVNAVDPDGTVSFVDFYRGSNWLGRGSRVLTNNNYNLTWSNAPAGTFQLRAEATDNAGGRGVSASLLVNIASTNAPATNNPPVVTWLSPGDGASFTAGSTIPLSARAVDGDGIVSIVDFYVGANYLGRGTKAVTDGNYYLSWTNAPEGTYQLQAQALDNGGAVGVSASVQIVVNANTNSPGTNFLPVVNWVRPTNGANFAVGSMISLEITATDPDGTISFVDFYAGATLLGRGVTSVNEGHYYLGWSNAPAGAHFLRAYATDDRGARVLASVQIVVGGGTNSPPSTNNILPVVNWVRPADGAMIPAPRVPILMTASATDADGTISFVDFYSGTNRLGRGVRVSTNTFNFTWTNVFMGTYVLHAEAVDNSGGRSVSGSARIFVGLSSNSVVDLGTVEVTTIGHTIFDPSAPVPPGTLATNQVRTVVDHLIDQDQFSGGGGVLPSVFVNWDTNRQFKLRIAAPPGSKFLVDVPSGRLVRFGGYLWWESTRGGFSDYGEVKATFTDLEGTAPGFDDSESVLSDSHGFFGFADIDGAGVTSSFAFTSLTLTGTVTPQYTGNGPENYVPHHESSLRLYYSTASTNDPGPFVSIVPLNVAPRIEVLATSQQSGTDLLIYGRAGRTHIVECSPDTVNWTAISTNVMPNTVCSNCPSVTVKDLSGITADNRFYRVVELP